MVFKSSNGIKGDYHEAMSHESFREWFDDKLLPNIPEKPVTVMDNAPYHSKVLNKAPTQVRG